MFIKIDEIKKCIVCGKETAKYMCIEGPENKIKVVNFKPHPWCEDCIKELFPEKLPKE